MALPAIEAKLARAGVAQDIAFLTKLKYWLTQIAKEKIADANPANAAFAVKVLKNGYGVASEVVDYMLEQDNFINAAMQVRYIGGGRFICDIDVSDAAALSQVSSVWAQMSTKFA